MEKDRTGLDKDIRRFRNTVLITVLLLFFAVLALGATTFAWFSSNSEVSTNRAYAETANADARLLLSEQGGSAFRGSATAELVQLNEAQVEALMPVSTDDLEHFVYKVGTGSKSTYALDNDEKKYYHGHVYIKAESEGTSSTYKHMSLYLKDIDDMLAPEEDSLFLNAARLGLKLEGQDPVIFYLSDTENAGADQVRNSYVDGHAIADDQVIHYINTSQVSAVQDPAVSLERYAISASRPEPLALIELDRIYELDVYFYLEGCDPDCSDSVQKDAADIYISLFGVLEE
jgi:hypothetical protein